MGAVGERGVVVAQLERPAGHLWTVAAALPQRAAGERHGGDAARWLCTHTGVARGGRIGARDARAPGAGVVAGLDASIGALASPWRAARACAVETRSGRAGLDRVERNKIGAALDDVTVRADTRARGETRACRDHAPAGADVRAAGIAERAVGAVTVDAPGARRTDELGRLCISGAGARTVGATVVVDDSDPRGGRWCYLRIGSAPEGKDRDCDAHVPARPHRSMQPRRVAGVEYGGDLRFPALELALRSMLSAATDCSVDVSSPPACPRFDLRGESGWFGFSQRDAGSSRRRWRASQWTKLVLPSVRSSLSRVAAPQW